MRPIVGRLFSQSGKNCWKLLARSRCTNVGGEFLASLADRRLGSACEQRVEKWLGPQQRLGVAEPPQADDQLLLDQTGIAKPAGLARELELGDRGLVLLAGAMTEAGAGSQALCGFVIRRE